MKAYKTKSGATQYKPSYNSLQRCIAGENNKGYCLACGETQRGVEPDARRYECEHCNAPKVYGAEELVLMGLFH